VFKPAGRLSGGEKARLALARLLVHPCNLLLLDEPTNHLDIPAKEMLEEALRAYEGSALVVSHDRTFLARVANRIVELRDGELLSYRGDYTHYLEKKREEDERALLQERERQRRERQEDARRRRRDKEQERKRRKGRDGGGEPAGQSC
jgi:ATP-binding cassette subfamily F protein 3